MKPFWLVGIEGQTFYCVGMTREQGLAFVEEHNAFYRSINFDDMAHLRLEEAVPETGYWADCGRFAILDGSLTFHRLHLAASKQHPMSYGRYVYPEEVTTWEEVKLGEAECAAQCEAEYLADIAADVRSDN